MLQTGQRSVRHCHSSQKKKKCICVLRQIKGSIHVAFVAVLKGNTVRHNQDQTVRKWESEWERDHVVQGRLRDLRNYSFCKKHKEELNTWRKLIDRHTDRPTDALNRLEIELQQQCHPLELLHLNVSRLLKKSQISLLFSNISPAQVCSCVPQVICKHVNIEQLTF